MARVTSIRSSLLINLVLVVLLLGAAIFTMMALGSRRAIRGLTGTLIEQTSLRTEAKLKTLFEPLRRQVRALRDFGVSGLLDIDDPNGLRQQFTPLLREFPWSSAIFVADEHGREYLLRSEAEVWTSRQIRRDEWGDRALFYEWSPEAPEPEERQEALDYDPRTRPWYQGAVALLESAEQPADRAAVYWTEPYSFFSTGEPGITAAVAFRDPSGVVRVVGIDLSLTEISRFTSSIVLLDDGRVFVLDDQGRMLGVPRPADRALTDEEVKSLFLKRPEAMGTQAAQDAADRLLNNPANWGRPIRLVSEGEAWWGQLTPFDLAADRQVLIGVAVGEDDILGQLKQQRLWVIAITLVVLTLAIWRAVRMAHGYSQPIEELVEESQRISTGDLEPGPPIATSIAEVQHLAQAHDRMRDGLKTLLKLERDLQLARQIQESTLPEKLPVLSGFDLSAWSQPADETGGDSYDVIGLQTATDDSGLVITEETAERAVLMLADATGHGIGPALSVTQLRAMLRMAVRLDSDLAGLVTNVNLQLCADLPTGRFITAWFGLLDSTDHTLTAFSAGQAPLLHFISAADRFEVLDSDAVPLGLFPAISVQQPEPRSLGQGDIFAVLSDGLYEALNPEDEEQGVERITAVIHRYRQDSAAEILQQISRATDEFTHGAPLDDDRMIVIIKRV